MRALAFPSIALLFSAACADPAPPRPHAPGETVPANSLDEARLHGTAEDAAAPRDPTEPYFTPMSAETPAPPGSAKRGRSRDDRPPAKGVVSTAQCSEMMDRYLDLEIASNPQLVGVTPEILEEAKKTAREKHGSAPCTANAAEYTCAMKATSTAGWQRCVPHRP
jgi:hypothetical protein